MLRRQWNTLHLQSLPPYSSISWCIIIWFGGSAMTKTWQCFASNCLHFKGIDRHWDELHPNWEGGPCVTWACERFQDYLIGLHFTVETDHKPLVPLLSAKTLDQLPVRVQWFQLRMTHFDYSITHVPGAKLQIADGLSDPWCQQPPRKRKSLSKRRVHMSTCLYKLYQPQTGNFSCSR